MERIYLLAPLVAWIVSKTSHETWRTALAWKSLERQMPKVNRAFNKVRNELLEVGLLGQGIYLDRIELNVSFNPSHGEAGFVYEEKTWRSRLLKYTPGVIYLPGDLPQDAYVRGGTLTDVIRHEFAHAWHWLDPSFFALPWFRRAFGLEYEERKTTPSDLWQIKLQKNRAFQRSFAACGNERERERKDLTRKYLNNEFASEYAATLAMEDFAETFMLFLRYRNSLDRFRSRKGLQQKLLAVQRAVEKARRENDGGKWRHSRRNRITTKDVSK